MWRNIYKKVENVKFLFCEIKFKEGKATLTFQIAANKIIVLGTDPTQICEQCGEESVDIKD